MKEADIQADILKYINAMGGYSIKIIASSKGGNGDTVNCVKGRFVMIEVKLPGKKARPLQLEKIAQVRAAGGIAEVVESLQEAVEILKRI